MRRLQEANFCSVHNRAKKAPHWGLEKRRSERFFLEEPVVLETQEGQLIGAVVMNYGQSGLYFESDFKAPRGTILHIRNESTLAHPEDGGCCAEVRWSKRLRQQDTDYHYGTGVRYC
ncbi:MAG: hypothetical protein PVJ53_00635 [Desulfobacterales bacterium]